MERIYEALEHIKSLWKKLEQTKLNTTEYDALLNQIRTLSNEYRALIDVPKKPRESKITQLRIENTTSSRLSPE